MLYEVITISVGRTYTLDGTIDFESIKSRIMVAGGGAGSSNWTNARTGGYGGALIGGSGVITSYSIHYTKLYDFKHCLLVRR